MEDFTKRPEFAGMPAGHRNTHMNYLNFARRVEIHEEKRKNVQRPSKILQEHQSAADQAHGEGRR